MQSHILSLRNFISSNVTPTPREASSSNVQGIDLDTMQKVKKKLGYAKSANKWIERLYQDGLFYIRKFVQFYVNVSDKRKSWYLNSSK